jgi:hypothetical protein
MTNVEQLTFKTMMKVVENSVGTNMFRNFYAHVDGVEQDVMRDGELSCAFFVSSILTMFGMIERIHGTVDGTVHDMVAQGWKKIDTMETGAVIVWEALIDGSGEKHKHIGFVVGENTAISNNSIIKVPFKHSIDMSESGKPRKIEAIYTNTLRK